MIKKLYKQQLQTKNFFELDAANWKRKSDVKNKLHNTILEEETFM